MARKQSAGIVLYRTRGEAMEVLLVHPGGPFWAKKDAGAWSIPKGEYADGEDPLTAARREMFEETGLTLSEPLLPLGQVKQRGGKIVRAWAAAGDCDAAALKSNCCRMMWPPGSGRMLEFPEVDRAEWFALAEARMRLLPAQVPFLERLAEALQAQVPNRV
ncbi:MAG TPA: NUDIX domain-containing protein [Candidatus Synoicihabitans sp.]|nr:NUDIX domain-containing protein [Candidatus Synoicihabitans sp.]